ncbi:hypothetical protein [Filimonas effusa]|uniref:Uncharacterized protein n=1 Tax=Filimonas effusa TaxID=2508721 RepID=A0A4Q1D1E9_9BACT|nr:hypothetical protein [Filimonas effusa]RXK81675.1 hypothetical protein ESB13_17925 [Filimonas effusa]
MSYEFYQLEELIRECLSPEAISTKLADEKGAGRFLQKVKEKVQNLKTLLVNSVIAAPNELAAETLVQFSQKEISIYLHEILEYLDPKKHPNLPTTAVSFFSASSKELESVLSFILRHFTQYFDLEQPVTQSHKLIACQKLSKLIRDIKVQYKHDAIDVSLLNMVLRSVNNIITSKSEISYRRMKYMEELTEQLGKLTDSDNSIGNYIQFFDVIAEQLEEVGIPEKDLTIKLHIILLYLNYNSPQYISHCVKALWSKMRGHDRKQKLAILSLYGKLMKQLKSKPGFSFVPEYPSALQQISDWIEIESNYLTNKSSEDTELIMPEAPNTVGKIEKVAFGMSSARLAVVLNVFMSEEIKAITDQNVAKVFRTFSAVAITPGSDNLNPAGLRSKANNLRKEAVEWTTDFFYKCYTYLRRRHLNK